MPLGLPFRQTGVSNFRGSAIDFPIASTGRINQLSFVPAGAYIVILSLSLPSSWYGLEIVKGTCWVYLLRRVVQVKEKPSNVPKVGQWISSIVDKRTENPLI